MAVPLVGVLLRFSLLKEIDGSCRKELAEEGIYRGKIENSDSCFDFYRCAVYCLLALYRVFPASCQRGRSDFLAKGGTGAFPQLVDERHFHK